MPLLLTQIVATIKNFPIISKIYYPGGRSALTENYSSIYIVRFLYHQSFRVCGVFFFLYVVETLSSHVNERNMKREIFNF